MRGEITRQDRALPREAAIAIVKEADYGVLATVNAAGEPSTVALHHLLVDEETLVFHCALQGEKISNILANPHVSFFVVGNARVLGAEFSTRYTSAVIHGQAALVEDEREKSRFLAALTARFVPATVPAETQAAYIAQGLSSTAVIKVHIEQLTGKARQ